MSPYYSKEGENWTRIQDAREIKDADGLMVGTVTPLPDNKVEVSINLEGKFFARTVEAIETMRFQIIFPASTFFPEQGTRSMILNRKDCVLKSTITTKEHARVIYREKSIK